VEIVMPGSLVFLTLGPSGTNHEFVARRYLGFHRLDTQGARVELVDDFDRALDRVLEGSADHIVQCAAHPAVARTTARCFDRVFVIDAFVASSQPMGLLARIDAQTPRTLALQPATRSYVDVARWPVLLERPSIVDVGQDLLDGRADAGIATLALAALHPQRLRVVQPIGAMTDGWLVYGRRPLAGAFACWPDSPAAIAYRQSIDVDAQTRGRTG
jgi:hypothetical protein